MSAVARGDERVLATGVVRLGSHGADGLVSTAAAMLFFVCIGLLNSAICTLLGELA